jgi:hypothetical protein
VAYGRLTADQAERELIKVYEAANQPALGGNSSV